MSSRPAWSTEWVLGQAPKLQRNPVWKKQKQEKIRLRVTAESTCNWPPSPHVCKHVWACACAHTHTHMHTHRKRSPERSLCIGLTIANPRGRAEECLLPICSQRELFTEITQPETGCLHQSQPTLTHIKGYARTGYRCSAGLQVKCFSSGLGGRGKII